MKPLILFLAGCLPFVFGYFQNKQYSAQLKPILERELRDLTIEGEVLNPEVSLDKFDVSIKGNTDTIKQSNEILNRIREYIADKPLRLTSEGNNLKAYGRFQLTRQGQAMLLSGNFDSRESVDKGFKGLEIEGEVIQNELPIVIEEKNTLFDSSFVNPKVLEDPHFIAWAQEYLSVGLKPKIEVSAKDNKIKLHGIMTQKLADELLQKAKSVGLDVESALEIVEPSKVKLEVSRVSGVSQAKGYLPHDYDVNQLGQVDDKKELYFDSMTQFPMGMSEDSFGDWVRAYFKPNGDRSFVISGENVSLDGIGTPYLENDWLFDLKKLGLSPKSQMELFPSEYHFPSYKVSSDLDEESLKALSETLTKNEIYFETGSNWVRSSENSKISKLANVINAAGKKVEYVIGGHADATGNVESNILLSRSRADSVVRALKTKGVSKGQFLIVPFGCTKATSNGSNPTDRRVEILVK